MKNFVIENARWLILAGALVLCECVYVYGTRYQHATYLTLYNRVTGEFKETHWEPVPAPPLFVPPRPDEVWTDSDIDKFLGPPPKSK